MYQGGSAIRNDVARKTIGAEEYRGSKGIALVKAYEGSMGLAYCCWRPEQPIAD